jgi:hypothetical protein
MARLACARCFPIATGLALAVHVTSAHRPPRPWMPERSALPRAPAPPRIDAAWGVYACACSGATASTARAGRSPPRSITLSRSSWAGVTSRRMCARSARVATPNATLRDDADRPRVPDRRGRRRFLTSRRVRDLPKRASATGSTLIGLSGEANATRTQTTRCSIGRIELAGS